MVACRLSAIIALALVVAATSPMAASAAWVDPPPVEPPQAAKPVQPAPPPARPPLAPPVDKAIERQPPRPKADAPPPQAPASATESRKDLAATEQQMAEDLFVDYLSHWSGVSVVSVDDVSRYYSFPIRFYGKRVLSPDELIAEKQRFIRRWPDRDYAAVPGTLRTICESDQSICHVSGLFAFRANDIQRRRASAGTGQLELDVSLRGAGPKIISENSRVVSRDTQ